jgi:hypothetical protein
MPAPDGIDARDLKEFRVPTSVRLFLLREDPTKAGALNVGRAEMLRKFIAAGVEPYGERGP